MRLQTQINHWYNVTESTLHIIIIGYHSFLAPAFDAFCTHSSACCPVLLLDVSCSQPHLVITMFWVDFPCMCALNPEVHHGDELGSGQVQ